MKINKCRNCKSKILKELFSLGNLSYTGKFPNNINTDVPQVELTLVKCSKCHLVQLNKKFDQKFLYGDDYGYRTGINHTMTEHVKKVVNDALKLTKIKKNEIVLDIASNDGTLLNFYPKRIVTVGIDPLIYKYKKFYKKINYKISNFFNLKQIKALNLKKFKIITALSVFYDLENPNVFLKTIKKILDKNGIFILEHTDLLSIIKNNLFDTICHEHLEYYSTENIVQMAKQNGLKVFNIKKNNINGGSCCYYICHTEKKSKIKNNIKIILNEEKKYNLKKIITYKKFFKKINNQKKSLMNKIAMIKNENKIIHGYGASTKGNVLIQFYGLNSNDIKLIADRNPKKNNKYTPGTKIKIVKEDISRALKPDYYLVLPWHFKKEILEREKRLLKKRTKFIFPLPRLEVISI
jgi:cyclopropane fatty-acyl-phospholipid synthase-like methyltransferase